MPIQEKCRILEHQEVGPEHFRLTLASAYISSRAQAGQFVEVKVSDSYSPLLRRPLSLHLFSKNHLTLSLLYHIAGRGTALLSRFPVGAELDLVGPLGEGFKIDSDKRIAILVAGGIGIAPFAALAETIGSAAKKNTLYLLAGFKEKSHILCEKEFKEKVDNLILATDDGSYGKKGTSADILLDLIDNQLAKSDLPLATLYACGPRPMLRAVAEIASQRKINCQVSMEERMACGIGACKGCAINTKLGYKMVCKDGPVFNSEEIIW